MLHHNAMTAIMSELFLETDHIWAFFTMSLERNFAIYLCQVFFTFTLVSDHFYSEILQSQTVLDKHYLSRGSTAELLQDHVLFQLRLEPLGL